MVVNTFKSMKDKVNKKVPGFDFDQSMFEDLVDSLYPPENFHIIFQVSRTDLDRFCKAVYGLRFKETYEILHHASMAKWYETFGTLAGGGNNTALKIVSEHIMKLDQDQRKKEFKITVCADLPEDDELQED